MGYALINDASCIDRDSPACRAGQLLHQKHMAKKQQAPAPAPAPASAAPVTPPVTNAPVVVPRETEVQNALAVEQATKITELGKDIIVATGELAGKYLALCMYIRQHKVPEPLVRVNLGQLGFKKSRVSEVLRVASASDKVFRPFEAKMIGFGRALEFARATETKETTGGKGAGASQPGAPMTTATARLLESKGLLTAQDITDSVTPGETSGKGRVKVKSAAAIMKQHAMYLAQHWKATSQTAQWIYRDEKSGNMVTITRQPVGPEGTIK